ncbi:MAG: hypothetical protein EOO23_05435 [Comamonadaceae bacterium]|nr:MAG: hypothetical protein EOO23_05435 [Comamonadaceae bacterium]
MTRASWRISARLSRYDTTDSPPRFSFGRSRWRPSRQAPVSRSTKGVERSLSPRNQAKARAASLRHCGSPRARQAARQAEIAADGEVSVDPTSRLATIATLHNRMARLDGEDVEVVFAADSDISERVIFPVTASQSNGIEDARFVAFDEDEGTFYRATYTAYDGRAIRSELIETRDFLSFRLSPLRGSSAVNKGMALFPRKLGGRYAMISRQDNENLHLIYSDDLLTWSGGVAILKPQYPWEFVQIGTCGSPIELDEGWLLLIHGVGAVRKYAIGAVLLDKADPSKVLGRLRQPFVQPEPSEREGYVPNVVYTCGAMRHGDMIVLPYAVSDTFCHFATVKVAALLEAMEPGCAVTNAPGEDNRRPAGQPTLESAKR